MTDTTPDYAGLIERMTSPVSMSMYARQTDMIRALLIEHDEAASALRTLLERNKELERERDQLRDKLHCMCGSPIDHSAWEGHTPVSVYDYSLDQERSRAEAAEARVKELETECANLREASLTSGNALYAVRAKLARVKHVAAARKFLKENGNGE